MTTLPFHLPKYCIFLALGRPSASFTIWWKYSFTIVLFDSILSALLLIRIISTDRRDFSSYMAWRRTANQLLDRLRLISVFVRLTALGT